MSRYEPPDGVILARSVLEPQFFTIIFNRYYGAVYRHCSRRVGTTVADDVAAETFVRAFERRSTYDHTAERALPWLIGIAFNLLAHHRRSEARQLRALATVAGLEVVATAVGTSGAHDAEIAQRLVTGLEQLDDYDREALLLHAWGDLRYREIAQVLGIPVGTVRSRMNRARRRLRDSLEAPSENVVQIRRAGTHRG